MRFRLSLRIYIPFHILLLYGLGGSIHPVAVFSQTPRCTATADRSSVAAGETVNYLVEISGPEAQMAGRPVLPDMNGIELLSPFPGESTSIQIINGVKSESRSFHYILRAVLKGTHRIEPAEIPYKGRQLKTNAVTLTVGEPKKEKENVPEDIFFKAEISRDELFVGEQLTVTFRVYTRFSASHYNIIRLPNYTGFWAEELPAYRKDIEKVRIGNQTYRTEVVKKTALFPAYPGELVIDAAELDCEVNIPRNRNDVYSDPFLSFFPDPFGQTTVRRLVSRPVTVKVRELPLQNQPKNFNGLVGQFNVTVQFDKNRLKTGEPVTCRIVFSGTGNIMAAEEPHPPFPADFEIFNPVTQYSIQRESPAIRGQKTIEWMAVPKKKGIYEVTPFSFSYYDPSLKKYMTQQTPSYGFEVLQGQPGQADSVIQPRVTRKLAGVKETDTDQWRIPGFLPEERAFLILFFIPPAVLLMFSGWRFVRPAISGLSRKREKKKIKITVVKNIRQITEISTDEPTDILYTELKNKLILFLCVTLDLQPWQCEADVVERELQSKGISADMSNRIRECIACCDEGRFSPARNRSRLDEVARMCLKVICALDSLERNPGK